MKNMTALYNWTPEAVEEAAKLTPGTVSHRSHYYGMQNGEALTICMDALLKYARDYEKRFSGKLSDDYILGPAWLASAQGIRALLNGDGQLALGAGISMDSKDNGCVEALFWHALRAAGYKEEDL